MHHSSSAVVLALGLALSALSACRPSSISEVRRVAIDPGHPSETSQGASGPSGATEIQVNSAVGQKLRAILEEVGYEVVITQADEEAFIAGEEGKDRMARAIAAGIEAYFARR